MANRESIRNLGIIAHIDHGKTTLTDALLAGAGLLSPKMVGSARVLDYLEEEQKRRITIKASSISILYRTNTESFVINLVDTPGHVDFTGRVTRALRAIDGAIVVVDAVEELMAQTELVTLQALEERVHPILFINKVDRLITELRLKPTQIQEKFSRIINNFNNLIEIYADPYFADAWKIKSASGNVIFGSALHRWGFTLNVNEANPPRFADIIQAYKNSEIEKLQRKLPLFSEMMRAVAFHVPSPVYAQKYRISKIWKGDLKSKVGEAMMECDPHGPTAMCITNVQIDPAKGTIANGRLFSGAIKNGGALYQINSGNELEIDQLSINMGAFREPVEQVSAGNIIALATQRVVMTGETLTDNNNQHGMIPFEPAKYISEPVVTIAIEPTKPSDLSALLSALEKIAHEDPNLIVSINKETGEYLLSGTGELHLEIATKSILDNAANASFVTSVPRVVYRETVTKKGIIAVAKSANLQNTFQVQVEPLAGEVWAFAESQTRNSALSNQVLDEHKNLLVDCGTEVSQEAWDSIISGFKFACRAGPLCGEPLTLVKVNLIKVQLSDKQENRMPNEIMHGFGKAMFGSFLTSKPRLLEPIYKTTISAPIEQAGECTRILNARRGKVFSFEPKGNLAVIEAHIPVAETIGISEQLRTTTSGRAIWQSTFNSWEKQPEKLSAKTITEIRKRKGLPLKIPNPSDFLSEE